MKIRTLDDIKEILNQKELVYTSEEGTNNIVVVKYLSNKISILAFSYDEQEKVYASLNGFKTNFAHELNIELALEKFFKDINDLTEKK